jgi:membrane-bound serine protease (ClpP class)
MIRKILCAGIVLASPLLAAPPRVDPVYVLTVAGVIDPVIKNYVLDGLDRARDAGAQAVLIRLDTPGGLLDATRDLIQGVLNAPLPVIVYVAPSGARAASAGVFITLAADVAAMAPLTHLGAAHPVQLGGGSPIGGKEPKDGKEEKSKDANASAMEEKMVSDAAAYARALASAKNRNVDWAGNAPCGRASP